MLTVVVILVIAAFITCVLSGAGHAPLWVSVLLLCVIEALRVLPLH